MKGWMSQLFSMLALVWNLTSTALAWAVVIFLLSVQLFSMIVSFIHGMALASSHTTSINKNHTRR